MLETSAKIYFNFFRVAMVSSPEVRQGALPPGFLVEREVEPVGRFLISSQLEIVLFQDTVSVQE